MKISDLLATAGRRPSHQKFVDKYLRPLIADDKIDSEINDETARELIRELQSCVSDITWRHKGLETKDLKSDLSTLATELANQLNELPSPSCVPK